MSAPTPVLERASDSALTDSTHSSSASAERYSLDELDRSPILLYNYHGSLETSSQRDLCTRLDKSESYAPSQVTLTTRPSLRADDLSADEQLRVTRKRIPRATTYLDVKRHDLYLPDEKELYAGFPNYDSSIASVKVPAHAYWSRFFFGGYDQLYIVSPESSPTSSLADSTEIRRVSPSSTSSDAL